MIQRLEFMVFSSREKNQRPTDEVLYLNKQDPFLVFKDQAIHLVKYEAEDDRTFRLPHGSTLR